MLRILTIVGARPQFIKASVMCRAFAKHPDLSETLLHTGQHYDENMSASFFTELQLPPPVINLGLAGATAERIAEAICHVVRNDGYDGILVYGDTTSTLAGALAAEALALPLFHVEAGLRSHNIAMPEEYNRIETDRRSALLFAPTSLAVRNLYAEGFETDRVILSGDVMLDSVRFHLSRLSLQPVSDYVFATIHRNFNVDNPDRLRSLLAGLSVGARQLGVEVLLPLHPRTKKAIDSMVDMPIFDNIRFIQPLSYADTLKCIASSGVVATDSGGLQKEAFFCGKPCVVLRDETEWQEIVDCGAAILTGCDSENIVLSLNKMWRTQVPEPTQFGDGFAAESIAKAIVTYYVR